jgi:hypothetical protein
MTMHVFPGGLREIAVSVIRLVVFSEEVTDPFEVTGMVVFSEFYTHIVMFSWL